ncbi:MAG: diguanylate cyclase [Micromonosporaceae bacterium]|nr:diguanylate cyclase [Micromonosporaceae bacterium]
MLEDPGGQPLSTVLRGAPMMVDEALVLARELAGTIAGIHRRGVIHKDLNPASILVCGPPQPVLIDFCLSGALAQEWPGFTHHTSIVGTPAYLAPEQTGRTRWPVDQRVDLYGLGATLYEMVTGTPPFGTGDLLHLVHDHLTRVPVPACEVNPEVPAALSAIIAHLLEKEPDRRYQSAEGLLHDLERLPRDLADRAVCELTPGERDFPWRIASPSRLVGRGPETEALVLAFAEAQAGGVCAALVSGQPGVGKTALVDELRPLVTAANGWFISCKFDQYRNDAGSGLLQQMARALARMLLAEPESDLATLRVRLRSTVGDANLGLLAAAVADLRPVLRQPDTALDGQANPQLRLSQAVLGLLAAIACPERPVVVVADDLQWAGAASIGFADSLLAATELRNVLLVCLYRDSEVDSIHPLTALLVRWQALDGAVRRIRIENLPRAHLGTLVADMLRMPADQTASLADPIGARTGGNPFDTVELINALRRNGLLEPGTDGWQWDPAALRRYLGPGDVLELLAARIGELGESTRELLEIVACLGGEVELDLLRAAVGSPAPQSSRGALDPDERMAPALETGLLVMDHSRGTAVRFRHDQVQQAAYNGMSPETRRGRHLALGRQLAAAPGYCVAAAGQYLSAYSDLSDGRERRFVAYLFRATAGHARNLGNYALVDRYLSAAAWLMATGVPPLVDRQFQVELEIERHAALSALGQFEAVDEIYERIQRGPGTTLERARASAEQVSSLLNRGRPKEALELGLRTLAELGCPAPPEATLTAETERGLDQLIAWAALDRQATDLEPAAPSDPHVAVLAVIIDRTITAAYFCVDPVMWWLVTASARLWERGGPTATLVSPLAHAAFVTIALRGDYATGYAIVRRILAEAEARGYEPATSQARFLYALSAAPWFEPLEETVRQARQAKEGLIRGGALQAACFTHFVTTPQLLDCVLTLDDLLVDVTAGLAFAERSGNDFLSPVLVAYRQAARTLRGETAALGSPDDEGFSEETHLAVVAAHPNAAANYHLARAVSAAIFGDSAALDRQIEAALQLLPWVAATQCITTAHFLAAFAAAGRARRTTGKDRAAALSACEEPRRWLSDRAVEAPGNFLHLRCLIEAEYAWSCGEIDAALVAFEAARSQAEAARRPWQLALITERLALLQLEQGAIESGQATLREASDCYQRWGATGKVTQLARDHPFLRPISGPWSGAEERRAVDARRSTTVDPDAVDMLAILRASQALSSETNVTSLQRRVKEVLKVLTGATSVSMLLRRQGEWVLSQPEGPGENALPLAEAAARGLLPLAAFNCVERTGEPLLAEDVTRDDRLRHDRYVREMGGGSLMMVPILIRGSLNAVLLLENRRSRAVLGASRLDTVLLIAGQLSVSLDNALLYSALERKVTERTEALREANERLERLAVTDSLTGLANRRRLTDALQAKWSCALRRGAPIAVAMIDIDHFKRYNDRYGHPAGDDCLRTVASTIVRSIRDTDLAARYGGEEFAVVLPDTDEVTACAIAERIRQAVVGLGEPNGRAGEGIVTVSVGVARTTPTPTDSADALILAADIQLYQAKRAGRNRVCGCGSATGTAAAE